MYWAVSTASTGLACADSLAHIATAGAAPGLLQAIVLALLQGVTEFLPVSSSAHLILPAALTDWPDQGLAFDVAVHLGTLSAALVYFRKDLAGFAAGGWGVAVRREWNDNADLLAKVCLASVPVAAVGWLAADAVETHLRSITVIALATIVFGVVLWWADARRAAPPQGEAFLAETPTYPQALVIGCAQALALIPGASRAGVTITAALLLGLSRTSAARFSFLLAIPAIGGASALMLLDAEGRPPWPQLGVGFVVAATSAFACITAFIGLLERTGMAPYAVYRVLLGVLLLALF